MKVYTRPQIREMIDKTLRDYNSLGFNTKRIFIKDWAETNRLYYHGLIRFLNGSEITIETYSKIMAAIDPDEYKEVHHYLARQLNYSDLASIDKFIDEIQTLTI